VSVSLRRFRSWQIGGDVAIFGDLDNAGRLGEFVEGVSGGDNKERVECGRLTHLGTELEFVIMVIAVSCVKLLSAHNSTQHTSRKHKV
jgi:hypothetical protein